MKILPKLVAGAMLLTSTSCKKPSAGYIFPQTVKTADVFVGQNSVLPQKANIFNFISDMFLGKLTELSAKTGVHGKKAKLRTKKSANKSTVKHKRKTSKTTSTPKKRNNTVIKKSQPVSPTPKKVVSTMIKGRFWVSGKNISYAFPEEHTVTADMQKGYLLSNLYGVSLFRMKIANPDINFDKAIPVGTKLNIPGRYFVTPGTVKSFGDVVKTTGVDKHYIKDILIGIEGRHQKPDLKAYYDGVKDRLHPRGVLTIGFGHTGRVDGQVLTPGMTITNEKAYELLAQDILDAKVDAIVYMGKPEFNKAPESIQTGLIDIVFNKGVEPFTRKGSPTTRLKKNLEDEHYASAAANMVLKPTVKGLKKRNIYRSIMSMGDLSSKEREAAMKALRPDYIATISCFSGGDKVLMQRAWANAKQGKTHDFFGK